MPETCAETESRSRPVCWAGALSHTPADQHAQPTPTWNHTVSAWRDLPHPSARPRGAAGARQGRGAHRPGAGASLALRDSVQGRLTSLVAVLGPPFRGAGGAKTLPASAGGHSPEGSHHPNGVTCTLLFPPVQRRARRRAGRRAERRDCPPGGRTGPHFCSPVCKGPPSLHVLSLPRCSRPAWRRSQAGQAVHAPRRYRHQSKSREPERCPLSVLRKTLRTQGGHRTGGVWTGTEKRGARRRHSGREQCGSQLRSPPSPSPNIKHSL